MPLPMIHLAIAVKMHHNDRILKQRTHLDLLEDPDADSMSVVREFIETTADRLVSAFNELERSVML